MWFSGPKAFVLALIQFLLAPGLSDHASAQDEQPLGELVARCASCHGADGISKDWHTPNLSGQHYQYLLRQLQLFRLHGDSGHTRHHATMETHVRHLSARDMERIAQHYAAQTCDVRPASALPPPNNLCVKCHGVSGLSDDPAVPNLAGQRLNYMMRQLELFRQSAGHSSAVARHHGNQSTYRRNDSMEDVIEGVTEDIYFTLRYYAIRRCH